MSGVIYFEVNASKIRRESSLHRAFYEFHYKYYVSLRKINSMNLRNYMAGSLNSRESASLHFHKPVNRNYVLV